MTKQTLFIVSIFILFTLSACEEPMIQQNEEAGLEGFWFYKESESNDFVLYEKSNDIDNQKIGFWFEENGTMIEREYINGCCKPSDILINNKGKIQVVNEKELVYEISNLCRKRTMHYKIIEISKSTLKLKHSYISIYHEKKLCSMLNHQKLRESIEVIEMAKF